MSPGLKQPCAATVTEAPVRFAATYSRALAGMEAPAVRVEAHITGGLSSFGIVGMPETAVRESRDRVRSAILSAGFRFPDSRLTVNLAPADQPKTGGRFDLAIAVAVLAASGQIVDEQLEAHEFLAELGLQGDLRPVRGTLLAAQGAARDRRRLVVAEANGGEGALVPEAVVLTAHKLLDVSTYLAGVHSLHPGIAASAPRNAASSVLGSIRGHAGPKRALVVAAAGGHNLLMQGPPGTGKTLLARGLQELLPPLDHDEALEVAAVHSLAGLLQAEQLPPRPFRMPHHSASAASLLGGGSSQPVPGEMSLAHHGVLFLDELPEFSRPVLESLREPLESGEVAIARARGRALYPARFQLIAAMNPCPSGYDCQGGVSCQCPPGARERYQGRLSGPLLDRIDLHVQVPPVPVEVMAAPDHVGDSQAEAEQVADWRQQVAAARRLSLQRQGCLNAHLGAADTDRWCQPDPQALELLKTAATRLQLSARGWHRTLRVARTLADLEADGNPAAPTARAHVAEALAFRQPDLRARDA